MTSWDCPGASNPSDHRTRAGDEVATSCRRPSVYGHVRPLLTDEARAIRLPGVAGPLARTSPLATHSAADYSDAVRNPRRPVFIPPAHFDQRIAAPMSRPTPAFNDSCASLRAPAPATTCAAG
jgi:hypothetical protein